MNSGVRWLQYTSAPAPLEIFTPCYGERGFLPEEDPLPAFPDDSNYTLLDEIGCDLPNLLLDKNFRTYARSLRIPPWRGIYSKNCLPFLRLYYLRLGFLASAYVNQVGQQTCGLLPANIAAPFVHVCKLLNRPPILSYDGYALFNWRRFDKEQGIRVANIDTIQNFVVDYDEHWFILIHVEIEAIAARILKAIASIAKKISDDSTADVSGELDEISQAVFRQVETLKRIPEKMDPALYYKTFRPYIRFFENVTYQGVDQKPINFRGETGAQSSIMPVLVALTKIPHRSSVLTQHLKDMRLYMPVRHNRVIEEVASLPDFRVAEYKGSFNAILDAMIEFRKVHYRWADNYIHQCVTDPRGTGGTPYMKWLEQLIQETEQHKLPN